MFLRKILRVLLSRAVIVSLLILFQLAFLMSILLSLTEYAGNILLVFQFISFVAAVYVIAKDENPSYKIAWVVVMVTLPVFGGLFYLMWGNKTLSHKQSKQIDFIEDRILTNLPCSNKSLNSLKDSDPQLATQAKYVMDIAKSPLWQNTTAEYFHLGEDKYQEMLVQLKKAEKFIFMEYFIIEEGVMWEGLLEVLSEKAGQGVDVRIMYDDVGCLQTLPYNYHNKLQSLGIKVTVFNPFKPHINIAMNYRDHRKICVIDGNVGFCGGINLADEYINHYEKHGHWKDTAVMITGSGVWSLTMLFLSVWDSVNGITNTDYDSYKPTIEMESQGYVQPYGDTPHDIYNVAEYSYFHMINRATDYLYITTPYLIIDNEMITALKLAAQSGVDVRIITPHVADKWYVHMMSQAFYSPLVKAGVRIYEYTPGFVHAKMIVSDDKVASVGTVNMDFRSFFLHYECGIHFYQSPVVTTVKEDILATLEKSKEFTLEDCNNIPISRRILSAMLRIFAPMM